MRQKSLILQWHITERCDRRCRHCYMYDENRSALDGFTPAPDMDLERCKLAIRQFVSLCKRLSHLTPIRFTPKFVISGGDPLLHPDLFAILEYAREYSDQLVLLGNPDHLGNGNASRLAACGVTHYQLSLDGMQPQHDFIRGRGSFQKSLEGHERLTQAGIKTQVMFTLYQGNQQDLLPLMRLMNEMGVDSFSFSRMAAFGNARDLDNAITPVDYRKLLLSAYQLQTAMRQADGQTCFPFKDHLWKLLLVELEQLTIHPQASSIGRTQSGCHMGQSFLVLLTDGTVMACRRFHSPVGKFPESSLENIFLGSKKMAAFRRVKAIKNCRDCELLFYCRGCRAVAAGYYGNWQQPDPQCWRFANT